MTAARSIARWALGLRAEDVPPGVRHAVSLHLLDGLGCGLAAARLGEAHAVIKVAAELGGRHEATMLDGARVAAPNAALANGALIHALDFDDTHADALVHVTAAVLPAALAAAEATEASGEELVTTCSAGFEVVIRLGAAVRHGFHAHGFHATSVCGVFAAALTAARLYGLDEDATVDALGIAGSLAGGSLQFLHDGSSTKQLHPGLAGHAGLLAARLAAAGASGPESIFEGELGLYRSYAGARVEAGALTADLGTVWRSSEIAIKRYPACQLSHPSFDALRSTKVAARDVETITFRVPEEAVPIVCEPQADKRSPRSPYEAKFSLQWCAAAALIDGSLGVESFAPSRLSRPDVAALAQRVRYEAYDPGTAAANADGSVVVRLRDGSETSATSSADGPLDEAVVLEKFYANAPDHAHLVALVLAPGGVRDVSVLTRSFASTAEVA